MKKYYITYGKVYDYIVKYTYNMVWGIGTSKDKSYKDAWETMVCWYDQNYDFLDKDGQRKLHSFMIETLCKLFDMKTIECSKELYDSGISASSIDIPWKIVKGKAVRV